MPNFLENLKNLAARSGVENVRKLNASEILQKAAALTAIVVTSIVTTTLTVGEKVELTELADAPAAPAAGKVNIYAKDDGKPYAMNSAEEETPLGGGGGNVDVQTFTESGSWTKPENATKVLIRSWGAGGSGARRAAGNASGGGGGGYEELWLDADDLGATEDVIVGAGGAAVSGGDGDGNRGGDNSVGLGANLVTNGGFDSDTAWTKGTAWTIAAGVASIDGSQTPNESLLTATGLTLEAGKTYLIELDYTRSVSQFIIQIGTRRSLGFSSASRSAQIIFTAQEGDAVAFVAASTFVGTIDNVSIREVKFHHSGGGGGFQVAAGSAVNGGYSGGYLGRSQNANSFLNPLNPLTGVVANNNNPQSTVFAHGSCPGTGSTSSNTAAATSSTSVMGGGGGGGLATTATSTPNGRGGMSIHAGNGGSGNAAGAGEDGGYPGGGGGAGTTTSGAGGDGKVEIITYCEAAP